MAYSQIKGAKNAIPSKTTVAKNIIGSGGDGKVKNKKNDGDG